MKNIEFPQGDKMPLLGLGTWKSTEREAYNAVTEALRIGYRHIDCAARYGNEAEIGEALHDAIEAKVVTRKALWITSKLWNNAHHPDHVVRDLKQTLKDLQLDYLDLYLIHWPVLIKPEVGFPSQASDFVPLSEIPIRETWEALEKCVEEGLCKNIGVSNFSISDIQDILTYCRIRPTCNQVESHPFLQQHKLLEYCQQENIALTGYSPLGSLDRPKRLIREDNVVALEHPVILDIAARYQATAAQVILSWAMERGTAVIPKSSNPQRLKENFDSIHVQLDEEAMSAIKELEMGYRYIDGSSWTLPGSGYNLEDLWEGYGL